LVRLGDDVGGVWRVAQVRREHVFVAAGIRPVEILCEVVGGVIRQQCPKRELHSGCVNRVIRQIGFACRLTRILHLRVCHEVGSGASCG
jgi:hypothetical protein